MKKTIEQLIKVANYLDNVEMHNESNILTKIAADLVDDDNMEHSLGLRALPHTRIKKPLNTDGDLGDPDISLSDDDADISLEDDMDEPFMYAYPANEEEISEGIEEIKNILIGLDIDESTIDDIVKSIRKDKSNVTELSLDGGPTIEDEEMNTDDMFNKADDAEEEEQILDDMQFDEEQAEADELELSEIDDVDPEELLKDDPELLEWYRNLGS